MKADGHLTYRSLSGCRGMVCLLGPPSPLGAWSTAGRLGNGDVPARPTRLQLIKSARTRDSSIARSELCARSSPPGRFAVCDLFVQIMTFRG